MAGIFKEVQGTHFAMKNSKSIKTWPTARTRVEIVGILLMVLGMLGTVFNICLYRKYEEALPDPEDLDWMTNENKHNLVLAINLLKLRAGILVVAYFTNCASGILLLVLIKMGYLKKFMLWIFLQFMFVSLVLGVIFVGLVGKRGYNSQIETPLECIAILSRLAFVWTVLPFFRERKKHSYE